MAEFQIYDSERMELLKLVESLNHKYAGRSDTWENIVAFQKECEDRFRKLGFEVTVDTGQSPPQVVIEGRIEDTDFDPDKMKHEVKSGVADQYWEQKRKQG